VLQATKDAQLIFGFFALKKSFVDSAEFVTEYNGVNNQPATPCPAELQGLPGACSLDGELRAVMDRHNVEDHKKKGEGGAAVVAREEEEDSVQ
jgi:hypothetical protein